MSPTSKTSSSSTSLRSLLGQHELKLLNFSVIVYVCLGALVFHFMGEFDDLSKLKSLSPENATTMTTTTTTSDTRQPTTSLALDEFDGKTRGNKATSLAELRRNSVQRMWNITNQLNILYENNWTRLVMDELIEFERRLMVTLERETSSLSISYDESGELELSSENEESDEVKDKDDNKRSKRRSHKAQIRSIKRSLVHSIATITTIGSPSGGPASPWGKLATVAFGAIGIPMLFYTVAKTGDRLAQSSVNLLLILRHYCLSLPAHYLCCCCGACNPFRWLSWLLYCCCCCCCLYLWCPKKRKRKSSERREDKNGGCCCRKETPVLKLVDWSLVSESRRKFGKKSSGGARRPSSERWPPTRGEDTGAAYGDDGGFGAMSNQQLKSVRFVGGSRSNLSHASSSSNNNAQDEQQVESPYSFGTFTTCLMLLVGYLLVGAYVQSRDNKSISLVESLYSCYQLLSMTKLPDSFAMATPSKNPIDLYKSLKSEPNKELLYKSKDGSENWTDFAIDLAYLMLGLHLIAMLGHLTKYYLSNEFNGEDEDEDELSGEETNGNKSQCNGQVTSLMGTLSGQVAAGLMGQETIQMPRVSGAANYLVQAANFHQSSPLMSDTFDHQHQMVDNQIDLAELLVVQNQQPQLDIYGGHVAAQQVVTSDMSLTSDRSSDPRSLCLHHQQQLVSQPGAGSHMTNTNSMHDLSSGTNNTICSSGGQHSAGHYLQHNHHNHMALGGQQQPPVNGFAMSRAGSRQSTLTRPMKAQQQIGAQLIISPTEQVVTAGTNGFEQDSNTLDTNSNNTTSSLSSRRIGFQVPAMQQMHNHEQNGFDHPTQRQNHGQWS